MLKIVNVEIRNFMSFGDEAQKINLQDRSLVLLEGQNLKSSSASSNGAGKTNILEAIVWCLYGKTTKNVSVAEVVNNHSKKNCVVSVLLMTATQTIIMKSKDIENMTPKGMAFCFLNPSKSRQNLSKTFPALITKKPRRG